MKYFIVILLWLSLCCQCFVQLGVVSWYEYNKKDIAEKYCVNKNNPKMHCDGKCYLKKQLHKANNNESSKDQNTVKQTDWTVFILPEIFKPKTFIFPDTEPFNAKPKTVYSFLYLHSSFRPPQLG